LHPNPPLGAVVMRTDNHQLLQPLFLSTLSRDYLGCEAKDIGRDFVMNMKTPAAATHLPTTC